MTTTAERLREGMSGRAKRVTADAAFRRLALACGVLVLLILGLITLSMSQQAWPALSRHTRDFFTTTTWDPNADKFGALGFVYGTVISSVIALIFAVPISVGIALLLTEVAPAWLRRPATFVVDLLAAVPSVVFGLWGVLVLAPNIQGVYDWIARVTHPIPGLGTLFSSTTGGGGSGRSFFTTGIIFALMVTPIVTAITREVFATTPPSQKEAALALGATRWEMIRVSVFPHSRHGFVGAVLLGLGRAMGETIAAALVIGSSVQITGRLFSSGDSMAAVIANQFGEASGDFRAALIGLGVLLFALTIVVNLIARVIVGEAAGAASVAGR